MWRLNWIILGLNMAWFCAFTGPTYKYFTPPAGTFQIIQLTTRVVYSHIDRVNAQLQRAVGRS